MKATRTPSAVSVDVFDTVLTRMVGRPGTVFDLVGRELEQAGQLRVPASQFRPLRELAEEQRRARGAEATIGAVHDELSKARVVRDASASLAAELGWEQRLIVPVPGDVLDGLRARAPGATLVFVSDSPLRAAFLRERLGALGLIRDGDDVITSGDEGGATKRGGALFDRLLEREGVSPARWLHAGNERWADVEVPRRSGLQALHLPAGNLSPHEERLAARERDVGPIASVLAGAARLARLELGAPAGTREAAIASLQTGVFGPTLAAFVIWLLKSATDDAVERLFFISRDGQVLLRFADEIAPVLGLKLDRRYLYGGRQAINLPSLHEAGQLDARARTWIFMQLHRTTIAGLARRVGLDVRALRQHLGPLAVGLTDDEVLGARAPDIESALLGSAAFAREVLGSAASRHPAAVAYLRRIGLLEPAVRSGIVDLGWTGSMLRSLQELARGAGLPELPAYVYGLHNAPSEVGPLVATAFAQDGRRTGQPLPWPHEMLEIACVADHGPVTGYSVDEDGCPSADVEPLDEEIEAWGGEGARRALRASARWSAHALDASGLGPATDADALRLLGMPVLGAGVAGVSADEAAALGDFPHREAQEHQRSAPLAAPLRTRDVIRVSSHRFALLRDRRSSGAMRRAFRARRFLGKVRSRLLQSAARVRQKGPNT